MTLTCDQLLTYLSDYIDNNLDEPLVEAAREHLATCQNCRVMLNSTQKTILILREHEQSRTLSAERHETLYQELLDAFLQHPST
jgi:predicted anti-sigma-YlaC factor YlaD